MSKRIAAVVAGSAVTVALGVAVVGGPSPAQAFGKPPAVAVFSSFKNHTAHTVKPTTRQKVSASVRVVARATEKAASGRVWLVDQYGTEVSPKKALGATGWATVSEDLPAHTLPGTFTYRVRYGGSGRLMALTSPAKITVTVPGAPAGTTTIAAAPDYINEDLGDLSTMPGWSPSVGNSWSQGEADSVQWVLSKIASYHPDSLLLPGDLVQGRWGNPVNNTGVFGTADTVADQVAMLTAQAGFYFGQDADELKAAGLYHRTLAAVGDHDIGDNWWNDAPNGPLGPGGVAYNEFKREHLSLWRDAFASAFDTTRFADRPSGSTEWSKTAYATMISANTMVVTLDEFETMNSRNKVVVTVSGDQLAWLDTTLARARARGVKWIIVQGHTPILPSKVGHSSGLHVQDFSGGRVVASGAKTQLWKTLAKYHVNLYLCGETHQTSRTTADGVTQIDTGAPLMGGHLSFLVATISAHHISADVYAWDISRSGTGVTFWQGGCAVSDPHRNDVSVCGLYKNSTSARRDYDGIEPSLTGHVVVYDTGAASAGDGTLVPWTGTD